MNDFEFEKSIDDEMEMVTKSKDAADEVKKDESSDLKRETSDTEHGSAEGHGYKASKDIFRILGLTVSGLVLVISILTLTKCFTPDKEVVNTVLSYNMTSDVEYKVNLVDNNFYEKPYLGMNELIPSNFVKNIEIDFSNAMSASQLLPVNYSYSIYAELVANATDLKEDDVNNRVWAKVYPLKSNASAEGTGAGYSIVDSVVIDYDFYNEFVNKYKMFAAIPIDASLNVTLKVSASGTYGSENLVEESVATVSIPLAVSTINITTSGTGDVPKSLTTTTVVKGTNNIPLLVISVVLLLLSGFTTIKLLKSLRKMTEDHSLILKLNKILKDYSQVIVETVTLPDMRDMATIEVIGFRDMIDIQKELHVPILYQKDDVLEENVFYIINQNQVFKYKLNGDVERI